MTDTVQSYVFHAANARGVTVTLHDELQKALQNQALPIAVKRLAADMAAAALLMAASANTDRMQNGSLRFQIAGDGPIKLAVAEVRGELEFRVTVQLAEGVSDVAENATFKELVNENGHGRCGVIIESGDTERSQYTGVVPLESDTVAQALEDFFTRSEQIETRVILAADDTSAGGILLQRMPSGGGELPENYDENAWSHIVLFANTVKSEELLTLSSQEIDRRLFWEENPEVITRPQPHFVCTCSRERVETMIRSIGEEEAFSIVKEQGGIDVRCDFCGAAQHFDEIDVKALFETPAVTADEVPTMH